MDKDKLIDRVSRIVVSPKGLLAIDESFSTCNERFEKLGVPTTAEKRQDYRELLVTAPDIEQYVSAYILFDETIRQSTKNGKSFVSVLQSKGINVGIKADEGLVPLKPGSEEKVTAGLDGLDFRLKEYANMGAIFAKWRAVYTIGAGLPSEECMKTNAKYMAKYAMLCQAVDIVPIIEPEVSFDGDHSIEQCFDVTAKNLDIIFTELRETGVFIPGIILKTGMVLAGKSSPVKSTTHEVAEMTIKCLRAHVPGEIGGIVFLSGGQSDEDAVLNLNEMHNMGTLPWPLTFSYGRAIQNNALRSWAANSSDRKTAQDVLLTAAKNCSLATIGQYKK